MCISAFMKRQRLTVSLSFQVLITFNPGAKMSTTDPKLEKDARSSVIVVAPTVITSETRAGEVLMASALSFPAATTTCTPLATSWMHRHQLSNYTSGPIELHTFRAAVSRAEFALPPRDIDTTLGFPEDLAAFIAYCIPLIL